MDIVNLKNSYTFYKSYEDENEIILYIEAGEAIHIWEGYFDDIFDTPSLEGKGWSGFSRDYHQLEGVFSENCGVYEINPTEYLKDLMLYKEKTFDFDETKDVFNLIVSLLEKAISEGTTVKAEKNNLLHNGIGKTQCVKEQNKQ